MKLFKIFILAFFAVSLIACGGAEERKSVYMEKAKASLEAGDLDKARIELKNVLQIDPKDAEAYYQLGKIFEQQGDYQKAFGNYQKAEELNPDLLENQARLGRFYLLLANDVGKAQEKIDFILSKDPDNAEGLLLKAAVLTKEGDRPQALKIAETVVADHPDHVGAGIFLATLYIFDNEIKDSIRVLDVVLKTNKDNERLNKMLAAVLVKDKDYERAEVINKKFLERNPDSSSSYNNLAAFYHQIGKVDEAEETLRASVENNTGDVERQIVLIKYINKIKGIKDAITELEAFIRENSGLGKLRIALAELYGFSGDTDSAINVYINAIKDFSEEKTGIDARISLSSMYINSGDFTKASELVNDAFSISPNDPKVNFLRAKLALREKDLETAIISLRIVLKETPENIDAYILLAKIYQINDQQNQVREVLNSAYENNRGNAGALLKLAKIYLRQDITQAEKIIDNYNSLKKSDYEGLSIKAAILNQNKKYSDSYEIAKILMDAYPDKPNGYLQAVSYYNFKNDKKKAASILEQAYINVKDNRKILAMLTSLQISENKFDIVINRIKKELSVFPEDVELKLLLAKVYMSKRDVNLAESLLVEVIDAESSLEEAYLLLSQVYQMKNDAGMSKNILIRAEKNLEKSIKVPLKLASIYEAENDYKKAINTYRSLYNDYPDNLIVINNLASLLSDYSSGEGDMKLAVALVEKLKGSGQPVFFDTIGWVYSRAGNYKDAIQYLTQAVKKSPKINIFNYHLGMTYKMQGDKEQARFYLEKSLNNGESFKEKELAEAALKSL